MLTGKTHLAKTSGKPGKTQLINHFLINKSWYLVDLPGYGWAQVSKVDKEKWDKMNREYLALRENMACTFVLIDSRIPPQKIDIEFINWLGEHRVPFSIIFTKADKPNQSKIQSNMAAFRKEMKKWWSELPPHFVTSSSNKVGRDEVLKYIDQINNSL